MRTKIITLISLTPLISLFLSCGNGNGDQSTSSADTSASATSSAADTGAVDELTQFKYDKVISNIPIPFDILREHASVPLRYDKTVVNATSALGSYSSTTSKALNLGIYGGDLAYSITYEKFSDMGDYLKCVKKLSDDLGIPMAFDQRALTTYKKYETNKDSLEKMVFDSYSEVDKTLRSNERIGLASLVVAGGWLEGLHTTLKTLGATPKDEKSKSLYNKIWEQKNHLDMIIGLLGQFKDDKNYSGLIADMNGIKSIYDTLSVKTDISEAEMTALAQKVEEVRSKIVAR